MGSEIGDIWSLKVRAKSRKNYAECQLLVSTECVEKTKPGMRGDHWWEQDTFPRVKMLIYARQNARVPEPSTVTFWTSIYLKDNLGNGVCQIE